MKLYNFKLHGNAQVTFYGEQLIIEQDSRVGTTFSLYRSGDAFVCIHEYVFGAEYNCWCSVEETLENVTKYFSTGAPSELIGRMEQRIDEWARSSL